MNTTFENDGCNIYTQEFYSGPNRRSYDSAKIILPEIIRVLRPKSVVDYGCGMGTWLTVALESGVEVAVGYEGPWVTSSMLMHPDIELRTQDAEKELSIEGNFDLAICLEVVEHLKDETANRLVEELVSATDTILFSGAIPYQGGNGHINEKPQSYWVRMFQNHGFKCLDIIRPTHWNNQVVGPAYKQNSFLFTSDEEICRNFSSDVKTNLPYDLVHPGFFELHRRKQADSIKGRIRVLVKKMLDEIGFYSAD